MDQVEGGRDRDVLCERVSDVNNGKKGHDSAGDMQKVAIIHYEKIDLSF